jgi:hypothetical protein
MPIKSKLQLVENFTPSKYTPPQTASSIASMQIVNLSASQQYGQITSPTTIKIEDPFPPSPTRPNEQPTTHPSFHNNSRLFPKQNKYDTNNSHNSFTCFHRGGE